LWLEGKGKVSAFYSPLIIAKRYGQGLVENTLSTKTKKGKAENIEKSK